MRFAPPMSLTSYDETNDIHDIAEIKLSTLRSSELSILSYGNVQQDDMSEWLRQITAFKLEDDCNYARISEGTNVGYNTERREYVVVRDLDLPICEAASECRISAHIVGHAMWRYCPPTTSRVSPSCAQHGSHNQRQRPVYPPGANLQLIAHVKSLPSVTLDHIARIVPPPFFELRSIATLASHLRHGIARKLVEWIFPYADRHQIPVLVVASPIGRQLYRNCGFEDVLSEENCGNKILSIDLANWGGRNIHCLAVMVRWPQPLGSQNPVGESLSYTLAG
jgi:hypothetical protein